MHTTTMKRIAAELGVSITTVSKVLNNHARHRRGDAHARARQGGRARLPAQRRRPQSQPAPHPHPRRRDSRLDALLLRGNHRRHRAGGERARLRPAALQLRRGSAQGAGRARHAPRPPGRRRRRRLGARIGQHRHPAAPREARHHDGHDRPRRSPVGQVSSRVDRRPAGRGARDARISWTPAGGRSPTSAGRRLSTPSGGNAAGARR